MANPPDRPRLSAAARWVKKWNEGPLALALLVVFLSTPAWLHRFDPRAGSFDPGYLHVAVLACLFFYVTAFVAWTAFRLNFPLLAKEFAECLEEDIVTEKDTPRTWLVFSYSLRIYFGYLAALLVLIVAVLFSVPR